jgi:hypothetical protein
MTGLSNGVNGNLVGSAAAPIDPLLGPLQDNSGPTITHALLPGSPAIDAGNNAYATEFDQRGPGYPRIVSGTIDIGAFEVQPPTQVTHYSVSAPASVVAGSAFNVTVKSVNDFGDTVDGYIGTVHFGSSDSQASLPSDYTFTSEDGGVHTFTVTLRTAGAQSITATDTTDGFTGRATGIVVNPAAASSLTFIGVPSSVTAGGPFSLIVTARDPFNNIATGYRGTVTFTSSDSQATLPANYTFTAADAGVHGFFSNSILRTAGSRTVTAEDTADGTITGSSTVTVNPALADHFSVRASGTAKAGTAFDLTVTALDRFNNTATSYTRAVSFTSTDASAVLPGNYTFTSTDAGQHIFTNGVTLKTAGSQSVTATDTVTGFLTGSATVTVSPAAADHLVFLQPPADTGAGQMLSPVMVEVVDAFGNVETGDDSDTITLSIGTNPGGGTLGGTMTVTVVNGVATFGDLSIDMAGMGYTLHATVDGGLPGLDSDPFNVT